MAYIGNKPNLADIFKLDDISSSFDGSTVEFSVTSNGASVAIPSIKQCILSLNGVVLEPHESFTYGSDSTKLKFTEAPEPGDTFFCIVIGTAIQLSSVSDGSIDSAQLAINAVTTTKIADANVTTTKIADANVTTTKIADANVTTAKIADANVTTAKLTDNSVTTAKIIDGAVTLAKHDDLAASSVIGNMTGSGATPQAISVLDEDDMSSDSSSALATQQSIKAYIDSRATGLIDQQIFTSSGTWTKPENCTAVRVVVIAGGGGGKGNTGVGSDGGISSFGSHCSATGGTGGTVNSSDPTSASTATPGIGSNGDINIRGGAADMGGYGTGGSAYYFPMPRPAATSSSARDGEHPGAGGSGCYQSGYYAGGAGGGSAIKYITSGLGSTETVTVGAGGSGGPSSAPGGDGADGIVIVESFAG